MDFMSFVLGLNLVKAHFFFLSETKKFILKEEKIQEKKKKTREGWEVLPTKTKTEQKRKHPTLESLYGIKA